MLKLETVIALLNDLYSGGRNPHEADPFLDARIRASVQTLSNRVSEVTGSIPEVRGPANLDSYHLVSWPLQLVLPPHPTGIDILSLSAPALYLTARVCHFAPLVELSWLEFGHENGKPYRRSAELLDSNVLDANTKAEAVALTALQASEYLGLDVLSWKFLRTPAPIEWPRQFWMPEQPELRNYLFPGFFETWPASEKGND